MYWEAITIIEARQKLLDISSYSFPNLKKSDREKIHRELHRQAFPARFKETKALKLSDLANVLGGKNG